jgi:hypothetical protein
MSQQTLYNDLVITGDLTVSGTTTTINTNNLTIEDKNIIIGNVDTPSNSTGDGGGLTLKAASDKTFNWVSSTNRWTSNVGVEASSFVRTSGTTAQFLKADGTTQELTTGKTIYVDDGVGTDIRTGFNDYDISKPFKTIGAAVLESIVGDLVYVRAGAYTISTQISLNNTGNIYFEPGTKVTVSNNVVAFALTANEEKSISGYAKFEIDGTGGVLSLSTGVLGGTKIYFECLSITRTSVIIGGSIFSLTGGTVSINVKYIDAVGSTVVSNSSISGACYYNVLTTKCNRLLTFSAENCLASFIANCETVEIYGTEGIYIGNGNTIWNIENCYISDLNTNKSSAKLVVFAFPDEDATSSVHKFNGGRWFSNNDVACITFNSTAAIAGKELRLYGDVELKTSATATHSIFSANPRNIIVSFAHATKPVNSNVTILGGTFIVDTNF